MEKTYSCHTNNAGTRTGESSTKEDQVPVRFKIFTILILLLMFASWEGAMAADRYSVATGNWSSTSTWSATSGGLSGATVPAAGDNVFIEGGYTVTLDANTEVLNLLSVATGSTFSTLSGYTVSATTITVNGTYNNGSTGAIAVTTMSVNNGGIYLHANTGTTIPTATWNDGSTCEITGWTTAASLTPSFNQNYYNFRWNCPNQLGPVVLFNGYVNTVRGTFTLMNTGTLTQSISPGGNPTYGYYQQTGGRYDLTDASLTPRTLTVQNDFSISGGSFRSSFYNGGTVITIGGNYRLSDGHMVLSRFGASATVAGNFVITGGEFYTVIASFSGLLTVGGNFEMSSGSGTLFLCDPDGVTEGRMKVAGNFTHTSGNIREDGIGGSGTIVFNGTGNQIYTSARTVIGTINYIVGEDSNLPRLQMGTGAAPSVMGSGSDGTFNILPGATLVVTSPAGITTEGATGNIQVSGARTYSAGANYIYNSAMGQVTGTGLAQNIPANVTINNSAGVTLTGESRLSGVLALTNGILTTGSNTLILDSNAPGAVSGASASSYVNGTIRRNIAAGANTYIFPVGTSTAYARVSIAFGSSTATGYLEGSSTDGDHTDIGNSQLDSEKTVNRTWTFSVASGLETINCNATFNWAAADQDAGFDYASAAVGLFDGTWTYPAVGIRNPTSAEVPGLTGFGDFQFGNSLVVTEPTVQAAGVGFSNISSTGMTVSWTNGDGARRIVLVREGSPVDSDPVDGTGYTANTIFGSGAEIGAGNYVVYSSTGNSVDITGLSRGEMYHVAVFEYNGSGGLEDYLAVNPARGNTTTGSIGDYRTAATGTWGIPATWQFFDGTDWAGATGAPSTADGQITILNGHVITIEAPVTVDQVVIASGGRVTVSPGIILTIANGADPVDVAVNGILDNTGTVTATGTLAVNDGGRYIHSSSGLNLPIITWNDGSTCEITGYTTGALNTGWTGPFYNFIWNCPLQTQIVVFGTRVALVYNNFTLVNSGTASIIAGGSHTYGNYIQTGGIYQLTNSTIQRIVTITSDFSISGGSYNIGGLGAGILYLGGDLNMTGGVIELCSGTRPGTLNVSGDFTHSSGEITASALYGTINFNGFFDGTTGQQTFTSGGIVSNTVDFSVFEGAFLQMATQSTIVTGDGSFYLSPGATIGITSAEGITDEGTSSGNIQTLSRVFEPGGNYVYNGTSNQTTGTGLPSNLEGRLIINNTGNIVTLIAGMTIENGGSLDIFNGVFEAAINLTMANNSTINRSGGSMNGTPQGTGIYNVNYTGNSMTTTEELSGTGLNDVTVGLAEGQTLTLDQSRDPDGNLNVTSGIFDLGGFTLARSAAGGTLTVADNAALRIGGINSLPANYTYTLGGTSTVEYNGEAQTLTPATYGNLILGGTGLKTINAGDNVSVAADLTTGGLLTIESSGLTFSGSLIVGGTSTGNVTYNRAMREGDDFGDKHLFSSPVGGLSVSGFITYFDDKIDSLRVWDEVNGRWSQVNSGDFISGKGYNVYQTDASDGAFSFTGPVTSSASATATSPYAESYETRKTKYTDNPYGEADPDQIIWAAPRSWTNWGGGGWNLLGNPFTSAMDAAGFISDNTLSFDPFYQALYVYDGVAGVYKYSAASVPGYPEGAESHGSIIQAGQGFMVMANYNGATFIFDRSMQIPGTDVPYLKSARAEDPWPGLQLKVKYGERENVTTVIYNNNMTPFLDPGYDIGQLSTGPAVEIYTTQVSKDVSVNFARQALPVAGADTIVVPVGIDSEKGGEVTFSAYTVPLGNTRFWLEDRTSAIFTDLTTKSYRTIIPANTYGTGRFFLHASTNSPTGINTPGESTGTTLRIWPYDGKIIIKGELRGRAICTVYDIRGQKVSETSLEDGEMNTVTMPAGSRGVYIVKVSDGSAITTQKVVFP